MYTLAPFFRYCSATLQSPSLKITTRCHSVFSLRSPVALSRQLSEVATLRLAIGRPSWVRRISGSLPRLPTKITLLTLPAIALSICFPNHTTPGPPEVRGCRAPRPHLSPINRGPLQCSCFVPNILGHLAQALPSTFPAVSAA